MTDSVAIVGMGCRFPEANSPGELWENVLAQRQSFRRIPPERLRLEDYFAADRAVPDSTYSAEAALIEGFEFDRQRYRVAGELYRTTDPTHWLALDVATQALGDAGFKDGERLPHKTTGVVVGNTLTGDFSRSTLMRLRWPFVRRVVEHELLTEDWTVEHRHSFLDRLGAAYKLPFPPVGTETLAGGLSNTIAGRICNYYDLRGGGYTVDGACASSLVAVSSACSMLVARDLDVALAGGVDLSIDPFELIGFAKVGALAAGKMRVYDERSEGFLPGEGCGFVVLMRHRDAVAEGRRIYAVIRGWGISSDGHGGMTRPEVEGQCMAVERAYRRAGFSPNTVGYFEGHGTGTSVGDLTEMNALVRTAGKRKGAPLGAPAGIGSVKANIGHTKAAAGVAGLIKAAMAVHTQVLPPTSGCDDPHPALKSDPTVLRVVKEGELWPADKHLRAGVNSLGFGGINAHLVLDGDKTARRAELTAREKMLLSSAQDAELFLLSAWDRGELLRQVSHLLGFAAKLSRAELTDLAAGLAGQLQVATFRAAVVAATPAQLSERLEKLKALLQGGQSAHLDVRNGVFVGSGSAPPRIGLLFPGQGAPTHLSGGVFKRRFDFVRELYPAAADDVQVADTGVAQPAILRASLAGLRALNALGVRAEVAVGHSLGEIAALCWAGALSEEALLRFGEARGAAMMEVGEPAGVMASINASLQTVQRLLSGDRVVIAGLNAPQQTVVAGEEPAVAALIERARSEGLTATVLPVSHAFHSPLMRASAAKVAQHLESVPPARLGRAVVSTVTGRPIRQDEDWRRLLVRQVTSQVRFVEAAGRAAADLDLFVEVGPGRVLAGLVRDFLNTPVISLDACGPSLGGLLQAAGAAFALGGQVNPLALFEKRFTRPFNLNWQPRFFRNPCELAPITDDSAAFAEAPAAPAEARRPAEEAPHADRRAEPAAESADGTPLELFRRLVAERLELTPAHVGDTDRLLGDLHLNSIAVSQLVTESAKRLGLPALASPTDYSTSTVAGVGQALAELRDTGITAVESELLPNGVDTWVRTFAVELVERAPERRRAERQAGEWQVFAAPSCAVAEPLRRALEEAAVGGGVCVVLPEQDEDARPGLLLEAAHAALAEEGPSKFVLVKHGGSGASFVRSFHLESPERVVCVVDAPLSHPRLFEWVAAEAGSAKGYVEAHYDEAGARREPLLKLLPQPDAPQPGARLDARDVLLVSGGGKGIAAECAILLARQTGVRLVLLGRSKPSKDPELAANLERVAALGIDYCYEQVDVTDGKRVGAVLRRVQKKFGPVTAFLHGAGANVPQLITSLDEAAVRRTLAPKIEGARNILAAIDPRSLRLFISFGSLIARTGMRGEADYALANEMLTHLTEEWGARHTHCRCLSVEWSIWSGVGMGERLGRVDALLRQGITPISPDEGLRVMGELVSGAQPSVAVVVAGRFGESPTLRAQQADLPFRRFLEKTLVHVAGVELVVETELTTDADPYIRDHVFQGEGLFPAVMGMEAMAQVAMALMETDRLPVFENVKFNRPIAVSEGSPTPIRIAALKRSADRVEVVIRCGGSGFHVDHFGATCRFAAEAAAATRRLPADGFEADRAAGALVPDTHLYGGILFQSGRFRRLQAYRHLRARSCVAEIRTAQTEDWFSSYLPGGLVLGDAAVRDASLHGIQACIPHQTILPIEVERVVVHSTEPRTATVLLAARERSHEGRRFVYDMEITDGDGRVLEQWEGLHLYQVDAIPFDDHTWVESLLGVYVERRVDELMAGGSGVSVLFERAAGGGAMERCAGVEKVHRRPDGRPVVAGELNVSASHSAELTMAVAGRGAMGCDVERACARTPEVWRELLGAERYGLARLIAAERGEDEAAAATRVWVAWESLKKAGASVVAPGVLHSVMDDGWVQLQAGGFRVATYVAKVAGDDERLALAVCREWANGGGAK